MSMSCPWQARQTLLDAFWRAIMFRVDITTPAVAMSVAFCSDVNNHKWSRRWRRNGLNNGFGCRRGRE